MNRSRSPSVSPTVTSLASIADSGLLPLAPVGSRSHPIRRTALPKFNNKPQYKHRPSKGAKNLIELPTLRQAREPRDTEDAPLQQEVSTMEELKRSSQNLSLFRVVSRESIVDATAGAAANEDMVKKEVFFPAKSRPTPYNLPPTTLQRHSTPDSGPPFLLYQYFSTRKFPKRLDPMEYSAAAPRNPPLSRFTEPSPMGLSMRKVDLQPRPMEKTVAASTANIPSNHSEDSGPPSRNKTPPGTKRWKQSLTHQGQLSGKENLDDLAKFWKLRFNQTHRKSLDETANKSSSDNNGEPGGKQRRLSNCEEKKLLNEMSRQLNEVNIPTGMPRNGERSPRQLIRKFRRHTDTF